MLIKSHLKPNLEEGGFPMMESEFKMEKKNSISWKT